MWLRSVGLLSRRQPPDLHPLLHTADTEAQKKPPRVAAPVLKELLVHAHGLSDRSPCLGDGVGGTRCVVSRPSVLSSISAQDEARGGHALHPLSPEKQLRKTTATNMRATLSRADQRCSDAFFYSLSLSFFFLFLSLFFALSVSLCLSPLSSGSFFFPYSFPYRTQSVGVLRSCLPASLSEHLSMENTF